MLLAVAAVVLGVLALRARPAAPEDEAFAQWRKLHGARVGHYLAFLSRQGVGQVLDERELLHRGRRWKACGVEQFDVPPESLWPAAVPTLRLLRDLQRKGLLDGAQAVSGFRNESFNRCEGGSGMSRHLTNQAFDLEWPIGGAPLQELCAAWRREGPARGWGLGFYTRDKIHVDTAGFRTWGSDYRSGSSMCERPGTPPVG